MCFAKESWIDGLWNWVDFYIAMLRYLSALYISYNFKFKLGSPAKWCRYDLDTQIKRGLVF